MRRVIICCIGISFPRGDAKANYMQYVSDALTAEGYQVELLVSTNPEYSEAQSFSYHGAHVRNIFIPTKSRILHSLLNGKLFWKRVSHMLEGYGLTDQDVIMAGTCMEKIVARLKKKYHFKTIGWPLEWFGPEQYATEKQREKGEWEFRSNANKDLLFPISHYIAKQFEKDPCKILILPIMADTQEVPYVPKNLDEKYSFIFPANGRMKDSLGGILKGLASLDESDLKKLTFHLTGVKEETVRDILTPKEFAQLDGTLVIHKWMQYEELVKLYQSAHYLFFARPVTQTTLSNFPSKVPEALTYGVVPVVSRVGEYTEYFLQDGVDSLIFDGDSQEACTKALLRALEVPCGDYKVLSQNARNTAETRFDYRNWQGKIRDCIEALF